MFRGVVGHEIRDWIISNARCVSGRTVYVGCSGAFTIETVLSQLNAPPERIISSDVSLYSSALGCYYTDTPFDLTTRPGYEWLSPFLTNTAEIAAAVVVVQEMNLYRTRKTSYHRRMWDHYQNHFKAYHSAVLDKLAKRKSLLTIDDYQALDVKDFVHQCPADSVFLSFMPFYAGDYASMFRVLDEAFEWTAPAFEELTPERKEALLRGISEKLNYVHLDDQRRAFMPIRASVGGGRKVPVYLYSNLGHAGSEVYYKPSINAWDVPPYKILQVDQELGAPYDLKIVAISYRHLSYIRDKNLAKSIKPTSPSWGYGVFINDVLVGVLGWNRGKDGEKYYLLTDTPVTSNVYRRISKLMCAVAKTKAMGDILRQRTGQFWKTFTTTARTQKAVSMKYRGVFQEVNRDKKQGIINYGSKFNWTREKAVKKWMQWEKQAKHSKQKS